MALDPRLLEILCCPACKGDLDLRRDGDVERDLKCRACGLVYPIEDGIPVMLVDAAKREA
ncbi:MAG TPA: Trm112 family protein [Holophagaceae bacterium]|nr:Trm112 family protein [Holophagaceae bacterium]